MALSAASETEDFDPPWNGRPFDIPSNDQAISPPSPGAPTRLTRTRLASAKRSYVTRRASLKKSIYLSGEEAPLEAGDLVLAAAVSLGQHPRIELPSGRRADLFPDDEIILACGARYAADQFEAKVPEKIGPCALVAAAVSHDPQLLALADKIWRLHDRRLIRIDAAPPCAPSRYLAPVS